MEVVIKMNHGAEKVADLEAADVEARLKLWNNNAVIGGGVAAGNYLETFFFKQREHNGQHGFVNSFAAVRFKNSGVGHFECFAIELIAEEPSYFFFSVQDIKLKAKNA